MSDNGSVSSRPTKYLLYVVFVATLGPLQFGYHLGELNAPQTVITCQEGNVLERLSFPQCIAMTPFQWGLVQSIFTVGGLIGAFCGGDLATRYGRLLTMRATTFVFLVGPLASALATNMEVMAMGRFLSGIGAGASTVVCPLYVAEVSPRHRRGLFGAFTQVMINSGIVLSQLLGYFLSHGDMWRVILAAAAFLGGAELVGLFFVPESPTWLAEHVDRQMAEQALQSIRGEDDIKEEVAGKSPTTIHMTHANLQIDWSTVHGAEQEPLLLDTTSNLNVPAKVRSVSLLEAIRLPEYRRAVIAVGAAMVAQQATGINAVVMYSVTILGSIIPTAAALVTVLVSSVNVLVTVLCAPLADKIGRKACLLLSIGGMGSSSFLLALGLIYKVSALSIIATFLFVSSFGVGLGPVPFILASELVDAEAVGATQSWGLAGCWMATFCVAQFFPVLNAALPTGHVFWVFVGISILLGAFIAWWLPESKGKASVAEVWADY